MTGTSNSGWRTTRRSFLHGLAAAGAIGPAVGASAESRDRELRIRLCRTTSAGACLPWFHGEAHELLVRSMYWTVSLPTKSGGTKPYAATVTRIEKEERDRTRYGRKIELDGGLTFSNGEPLTAWSIKQAWSFYLNYDTPYHRYLWQDVEEIEDPEDPRTLIVWLKNDFSYFDELVLPFAPAAIPAESQLGPKQAKDEEIKIEGTGGNPDRVLKHFSFSDVDKKVLAAGGGDFRTIALKPGERTKLSTVRDPKQAPDFDRIAFVDLPDLEAAEAAITAGEIDILPLCSWEVLDGDYVNAIETRGGSDEYGFFVVRMPSRTVVEARINTERDAVSASQARVAMRKGLDLERYAAALGAAGETIGTVAPHGFAMGPRPGGRAGFDRERAQQMIGRLGGKANQQRWLIWDVREMRNPDANIVRRLFQLMSDDLGRIGVQISPTFWSESRDKFNGLYADRAFDVVLQPARYLPHALDVYRSLGPGDPRNVGAFRDERFIRPDPRAADELEEVLAQTVPMITVARLNRIYAVSTRLERSLPLTPWGDITTVADIRRAG